MNVKIIGTGKALPTLVKTNEDLAKINSQIDCAWVKENLGVSSRHISTTETTTSLATQAAIEALKSSNLQAKDLDLIIVATTTPDNAAPTTACDVQKNIQAVNAFAFDLNAVCTGFIVAFSIAKSMIDAETVKTALVIGADRFSTITDLTKRTSTFFGDGAGAIILQQSEEVHFLDSSLKADGSYRDLFTCSVGDTYNINQSGLYEFGVKVLPQEINTILSKQGVTDVNHVIPHQASIKVLKAICLKAGVPLELLRTNMDTVGNTAAATIPILLDDCNKAQLLKDGDKIIFMALGSGMTWGVILYEW